MKELTIITRTSPLALWQAEFVRTQLQHHHPELVVKIKGIKTAGDRWLETPLYKMGGKNLFVKELEQALIEGEADIAVHSLKDMPALLPEGLMLAAICERENPMDAWVCPQGLNLMSLPAGSRVGTSSLRRMVQLKRFRQDLDYVSLRGNVGTRLQKCLNGEFNAIVLAAAGLIRLNLQSHITHQFNTHEMLPAVGQGALGIECRAQDEQAQNLLKALDHLPTRTCVNAERAMNAKLGGSCQVPIAGFAQVIENEIYMQACIGHPEKELFLKAEKKMPLAQAKSLGEAVAADLLAQGAGKILAELT